MVSRKAAPVARARKPIAASVTGVPCKCGYLERASEEPEVPIVFDAEVNEFHIANVGRNRGHSVIYHCPWCGGAAPRSKRATFFATVTSKEEGRLRSLVTGLATVEDAIKKLGKPDDDMPAGMTIKTPGSDAEPSKIRSYRTLRYGGLSRTTDVHFTDYGPDGGLRATFQGKYLGKSKR
jgi:hypothetical protein